jgi:diguanylate cyclase (GGDEF)-like protein
MGLHKTYLYRLVVERSRRDGLTNLYLRRVFLERLSEEINFSKRYGASFSVLILDLDHFKTVNDTYGHPIGDRVLKSVAGCLRSILHPGVTIARYGGEEFAILIGLSPSAEVLETAELIRSSIEKLVVTVSEGEDSRPIKIGKRKGEINMTVSVGAAHYLPDAPLPDELIRRADAALYWAKDAGRNCVREWKAQK